MAEKKAVREKGKRFSLGLPDSGRNKTKVDSRHAGHCKVNIPIAVSMRGERQPSLKEPLWVMKGKIH